MPPWANLLAFVVASAVLIAIPGPSVLFVVGRSLSLGRGAGLVSVLGNTLGLLPHLLAVAAGVGAVLATSAGVLTAIKLGGAAYLIFLGVQAIRHRGDADAQSTETGPSRRRVLAQGFAVGISNPKTMVFFAAVLPQFVAADRGAAWLQLLVLGGVFAAVALIGDSIWAFGAGVVRSWVARSPRRLARVRALGGGMMIGLGGGLGVSAVAHP